MSTGYLVGAFDLLNVRDLDLIEQARRRSDRLVVGVLTDELAGQASGRPPVVPLAERLALVSHVRGVDDVVVHEQAAAPTGAVHLVGQGEESVAGQVDVVLVPRRETASAALRDAVRPVRAEDVA